MVYITGDIHGNYFELRSRIGQAGLTEKDTLIILGDAGFNYFSGVKDTILKEKVKHLGITVVCIHGNHEARPETISSYKVKEWCEGEVFYEEEYPNILFAKDGEIYNIDGKKTLVCGGAYSVDKYYRVYRNITNLLFFGNPSNDVLLTLQALVTHQDVTSEDKKVLDKIINKVPGELLQWWQNEQPSVATRMKVERVLDVNNWDVDVILTHTCPLKFEPTEMFLEGLNQKNIDKKTEKWLNIIENKLKYKMWYAGHFHTDKTVNDTFQFLYKKVLPF